LPQSLPGNQFPGSKRKSSKEDWEKGLVHLNGLEQLAQKSISGQRCNAALGFQYFCQSTNPLRKQQIVYQERDKNKNLKFRAM
jgi:hypothetical protein